MMEGFADWLWYIESRLGFVLPKTQHQWLSNAIYAIANESNLSSAELYQKIQSDERLYQLLIDRVLIAESRFFRNPAVVDFVQKVYMAQHSSHRPFVVMSMGVSAGQELWSLAMALDFVEQKPRPLEFWGVDVSQNSLSTAKKGQYAKHTKDQIPAQYHAYIQESADFWQITDSLKSLVHFWQCNLFDPVQVNQFTKHAPKPDVIVCQNMLIYFRRFDQRDILSRFETMLKTDGYLILGTGEAMFWQSTKMKRLNDKTVNVWQK